jgi:hypothetical protein
MAAELIERASNPAYGDAVNEMAAWRFDEAVKDDTLRSTLLHRNIIEDESDLDELSFGSWLWTLHWRQRRGAPLDEPVLTGLTPRATSAERRLRLWVLVGRDPVVNDQVGHIDEFAFRGDRTLPLGWLSARVEEAASAQADPFEMQRHLLQIGTDVTLATLRRLLGAPGPHREALRIEVRGYLRANLPEGEHQTRWFNRLGLA